MNGSTDRTGLAPEHRCAKAPEYADELPVNPFVALRVAYGMLLGEDDFAVLMGNPRGKQMVHNAWLHGQGVVWGYPVERSGVWELKVGAGLAVDGLGRELAHEAVACVDVRPFVQQALKDGGEQEGTAEFAVAPPDKPGQEGDCPTRTVTACLVACFDTCATDPVPTLADPCDVTRKHDDYSRTVEQVSLRLTAGSCRAPVRPYRRVRMLLGLERSGTDAPSQDAAEARGRVLEAAPAERAEALLGEFRRLAALDATDLRPPTAPDGCYPSLFPEAEHFACVPLAAVEIDVRDRDGCLEIGTVRLDSGVRHALLPTSTIQELGCGLAPGLLGGDDMGDSGGPRVIGAEVALSDDGSRLLLPVTAALEPSSVPGAVGLTSLSPGKGTGWVAEDIYNTRYDSDRRAIVVELADRPVGELLRVIVRGTGPRPVMGTDPAVPLAGLRGGPPGTRHDGHDAVWTFPNAVNERAAGDREGSTEGDDGEHREER